MKKKYLFISLVIILITFFVVFLANNKIESLSNSRNIESSLQLAVKSADTSDSENSQIQSALEQLQKNKAAKEQAQSEQNSQSQTTINSATTKVIQEKVDEAAAKISAISKWVMILLFFGFATIILFWIYATLAMKAIVHWFRINPTKKL